MQNLRIGERSENKDGYEMIIASYISNMDITVVFSDDTVVYHQTYDNFKKGDIEKPVKDKTSDNSLVGFHAKDTDGKDVVIIEQIDDKVTVKYIDTGAIISNLNKKDVMSNNFDGNINNETYEKRIFSSEAQTKGLDAERTATYNNVKYMLDTYRMCMIVRPCGFGKTNIAIKLFSEPEYKRCLFLHPSKEADHYPDIINARKQLKGTHIDVKTYKWLYSKTDEEIINLKYDIVFFDECHNIGGNEDGDGAYCTYVAVKKLMYMHMKTHFVGATATPIRMDGLDVASDVFFNRTCYPYTEYDAIEDGLIKKPYYMYCEYNVVEKLKSKIKEQEKTINHFFSKEEISQIFNSNELEKIDAAQMPKHIRYSCDNYLDDTSYMRFIIFYPKIEDIANNKEKIVYWFKNAYPEHTIDTIEVHSRSKNDLDKVSDLTVRKNHIDLIFNCEMLCYGYHSDLLTGVIMDRKTKSLAKYKQMMGRLLSFDNKKPVIIFDIVDNLHADFIISQNNSVPKMEYKKLNKVIAAAEDISYKKIARLYPYARNWKVINANNSSIEERRLHNEQLEKKYEEYWASQTPLGKDGSNINKNAVKESLDATQKYIKENNLSYQDAATIYNTAMKSIFNKDIIRPIDVKLDEALNECASNNSEDSYYDYQKRYEQIKQDEYTRKLSASVGYVPNVYILNDGRLYQKDSVNIIVNKMDPDEFIDELIKRPVTNLINQIIEKWHTYPGCDIEYDSLDEVDVNSHAYRMLVECSKLYRCDINAVLEYMINNSGDDSEI